MKTGSEECTAPGFACKLEDLVLAPIPDSRTFGVFGGLNWLSLSPDSSLFPSPRFRELDERYLAGFAIGKRQNYFRSEIEYTFRKNSGVSDNSPSIALPDTLRADVESHSIHFNGYFDFRRAPFGFRPYVGAGFGASHVNFGDSGFFFRRNSTSALNISWQAIAGISKSIRRVEVFSEYRFFAAGPIEYDINGPFGAPGPFVREGNYLANDMVFGMRIGF